MKHEDVVLCYIRRKVTDKESRRGNDDDDDTQPQGPNASGYGDQLPQQMVKPMQNIESRYVGCDDELMNDMITQPQWPICNYQLSQLIVTCPMVEGNSNGELVVPEQLSTYQEEQVQNVEEATGNASSDYQVDPTLTGVLNNDECLLIDELGDFDEFMGENQEWLSDKPVIIAGNVFDENLKQAIDFDAVVKAIRKDTTKISTGTFSNVNRADMPSGMILYVKSLKSMDKTIVHHQSKMIRELEKLSKLCHDNLTRPIGFAIYEDVVLLLHQYYPNGTLAQFLHEFSQKPEYEPDWPTRLSIAIGVAEGLAFLHHVAIIHLDVSSGNVFLDSKFTPLVAEVEISRLLDPSRGTASISAVAGSFGYIPPGIFILLERLG
ncbi:hypothetical protein MTR67_046185 [Solanum verrucosum]|uniref:Protein kinase domain-containing protein n=1 Tax=Solanum verrucosum TaxID=315347 RepID=A0AAF0UVF8_SOLVR|nr:hypothetical protein MTR67_046185 [Solanum verrucosum]